METANHHILVPIDFSDQSLIALGQSYNLAKLSNAEITLLYVIEEDPLKKLFSSKSKSDKTFEKQVKEKLEALAAETTPKAGVKVSGFVSRGKIYEEIVKIAEMVNAQFIIMGTDGNTGIKKKFIGSNTLRVIKDAPCPVITIKGKNHRKGCRNIVLPLDLSKETKEKVSKAIEFAKYFNSDIRIVTIMNVSDDFLVKKLNRTLKQVKEYITEKGVNCTAESIKGSSIADEVIKYCEKVDADLLMIMTQQELEWTDLFISSQAQQIINHSDIPVISIRPTEKNDTTVFIPY
jgi:nucleotide-binding universal stress UspA family protein